VLVIFTLSSLTCECVLYICRYIQFFFFCRGRLRLYIFILIYLTKSWFRGNEGSQGRGWTSITPCVQACMFDIDNNFIGDLITSTLDMRSSVSYGELMSTLAENAIGFVRNLDPSNELTVLRMGSKRREVLVAPGKFRLNIFF